MSETIKLDFKKAVQQNIDYLKSKGLSLSFDYKEIQKEAHLKTFTIAKIMKLDLLADVQDSLIKSQKEGTSFKKWKKQLKPTLVEKGWYGEKEILNPKTGEIKNIYIGSRRLKTIFETNSRSAYMQGRANNIYSSANEYIQYSSILDSRTRPDHKLLNNIVKHRNDKFWEKNFPPNGWGCRCYVKSLSKKDLERKGLKVDDTDYGIIADKDFAYDTRNLSQVNLQNTYYQKVNQIDKNCIEFNARKIPCPFSDTVKKHYKEDIKKTLPLKKDFEEFITRALDPDIKRSEYIIAGYLTLIPGMTNFLKQKNITPQSDAIVANTGNIRNLKAKESTSKQGKVLSQKEIQSLVEKFQDPDAVYYDGDLLIVFDSFEDDKLNKIVIKIDFKSKKEIYNNIHSGIKLDDLKDLDNYEVIYKK